jgi:uncharacterized protein
MPEDKTSLDTRNPWVIDTRELGRRAGLSSNVRRKAPVGPALGVPEVIVVPAGAEIELDVLLESVVEGVLVAYPDSATDATTDEDEVARLIDNRIDLEPVVRDALVLALPQVPLCSEDCQGLCPECGGKWADLEPRHGHETIDPRWAALVERFDDAPAGGSDQEA